MKVHVILKAPEDRRDSVVQSVVEAGLKPDDRQPLLRRFGILRGEIDATGIERLQGVDGVGAVEAIGQKHALG